MAVSKAQQRAAIEYVREKTRSFVFRCNKKYDADIIAFLESKGNVSGYLKDTVRLMSTIDPDIGSPWTKGKKYARHALRDIKAGERVGVGDIETREIESDDEDADDA